MDNKIQNNNRHADDQLHRNRAKVPDKLLTVFKKRQSIYSGIAGLIQIIKRPAHDKIFKIVHIYLQF